MTIINLVMSPDRALLVTDTIVHSKTSVPGIGHAGKVLSCPDLEMVIAGSGSWFLTIQFRQWLLENPVVGGVEDLAREGPQYLRQLAAENPNYNWSFIIAVGMVGEHCRGYSFAAPDFQPQPVLPGTYFNPYIPAGTYSVGDCELTFPGAPPVQSSQPATVERAPTPPARPPSFSAESRKVSAAAQIQARLNPTTCGGKIVATWLDFGGIRQAVVSES